MGAKRTVRWGEQLYIIESSTKTDGIAIEIAPGEGDDVAGTDADGNKGACHFHIKRGANHQYEVTRSDSTNAAAPPDGRKQPLLARAIRDGGTVWIAVEGEAYRLEIADIKRGRSGTEHAADEIRAPMTGTVLDILAKAGDVVEAGQAVLVVEAMKMEHTLKAPRPGRLEHVACAIGDQVQAQSVLVTFEEKAGDPDESETS